MRESRRWIFEPLVLLRGQQMLQEWQERQQQRRPSPKASVGRAWRAVVNDEDAKRPVKR